MTYRRFMQPVGWAITFLGVVIAEVFFRAPSVSVALTMLRSMIGGHGVSLPGAILARLGWLEHYLHGVGITGDESGGREFVMMAAWVAVLFLIAMAPPNTLQMLARFEPAIGVRPIPDGGTKFLRWANWRPTVGWALGVSVVSALGILSLGRLSVFLYWQF
jgi:hypothetical protein